MNEPAYDDKGDDEGKDRHGKKINDEAVYEELVRGMISFATV